MSISSASAVTLTLIMVMMFLLLAGNLVNFVDNIEDNLKIHVNLDADISKSERTKLQHKIKKIKDVKHVTFSSKDEQYELMMASKDERYQEIYDTITKEENPLYDVLIVEVEKGDQLEKVAAQIEKFDGIVDTNYGGNSAIALVELLQSFQAGGIAVVIALTLLALFLISNTIKLTIYARQSEIAIMRNVGATNGFIKIPFMIEGMIIGILGSIIPILLTLGGYYYIYDLLGGQILSDMLTLQPFMPFAFIVSLILLAGGIVVGLVGSFFSTTKYLRFKR